MDLFSITAVWPFFILIFIAYIFIQHFGNSLLPQNFYSTKQKYPAITGLRSLLSLSVFFHHAVIFYFYFRKGEWGVPPSNFYTLLGQVPVAIFFSITGFLFWQKLLHSNGQIHFAKFILSRIKRIAPAYWFVSLLIILTIAFMSQFKLQVALYLLIKETALFILGIGLIEVPKINDINPGLIGAGIFWTLRYEWKFYLFLPLIAYFFRNQKARVGFYTTLIAYILFRLVFKYHQMPIGLLFLPGIFCAYLTQSEGNFKKIVIDKGWTIFGLLALICIFLFNTTMYSYPSLLLVTIFFMALIFLRSESWLYKILTSKAFIIGGQASYSMYILHTFILFLIFSSINRYYPIAEISPVIFWLIVFVSMIVVIIFSLISYRYIEHPFLMKY